MNQLGMVNEFVVQFGELAWDLAPRAALDPVANSKPERAIPLCLNMAMLVDS